MTAKWGTYRHFTEHENWGEADRISHGLLTALDDFRELIRVDVHVLCGTQGEHARLSKHYVGEAADVTFLSRGETSLFDLWIAALRFPFTGVGIYPHWTYHGKTVGGLHLELSDGVPCRRLWLGVRPDPGASQIYLAASRKNFRLYGVS